MGKPTEYAKQQDNSKLQELTATNVEAIAQMESDAQLKRGLGSRLSDSITQFGGSMPFVYLHITWFVIWILWNQLPLIPDNLRIDPFPFTFLTFVVSLEAIFLSTFILISQNHEERLARRRNHLDLQINLLSEVENSKMLRMLEAIQNKLGIEDDDDEVRILEERTDPSAILEQIKSSIESNSSPK